MDNTEKIINEFESQIKDFHPACTSDEMLLEVMKVALIHMKSQQAEIL